jgi:hypothetical protein
VVSVGGQAPSSQTFTFQFEALPGSPVTAAGSAWSDWLTFGAPQVQATLSTYPATSRPGFPVVLRLDVSGVVDPTQVEVEVRLDETGATIPLHGELFGSRLGILLWRDDSKAPHAGTMADYNQRYWTPLQGIGLADSEKPKKFTLVDRFIGGDDDRLDWRAGIQQLSQLGYTALLLPPDPNLRALLLAAGLHRTAAGVYNPPGFAFDHDPSVTPTAIDAWAKSQAQPYLSAGYSAQDMALFVMSDEPGWYYPNRFQEVINNPTVLARFWDYLKAQNLQPADVGASSWTTVKPIGKSQALDLPSRRLFYWTMRFYSWDSARHFANCTQALERAFYPNMPVVTNWNNGGRFYFPGGINNNPDPQSADAGQGSHDWLEFGRMRGGTMLWTEDWFADSYAYKWSFSCAKLRSAAQKSGVQFGGYIVPRSGGDRTDGLLQKALCLVGSGAKAIEYFWFGPEYLFPGNCYSEQPQALSKIAAAHRMIGAAEDLLWPGKPPRAQVAILVQRSAEVWDSAAPSASTYDLKTKYEQEIYGVYEALEHANIPVDFMDEEDLTLQGLKPYRVVYALEPDVPAEGQRALAAWVRAGGTLATVLGSSINDRYDQPCTVMNTLAGLNEQVQSRAWNQSPIQSGSSGPLSPMGVLGAVSSMDQRATSLQTAASFSDGTPAVVSRRVRRGRVVHYSWLPGITYTYSPTGQQDGLPTGFSDTARHLVVYPTQLAQVSPPVTVDQPMVEAPLLLSTGGAAVTLLNWTGGSLSGVGVTVKVPFPVKSVTSVKHGPLTFQSTQGGAFFSLPLDAADIVMLRP